MRLSRTTGVGAGLLVLVLGLWAGFIPFVGPYFHYGFSPDATWHFTLDRLWLNILPAVAIVLGGLMTIGAVRRGSGLFGSWLALVGGVWLLLGPSVSLFWGHTAPGVLQSGIGTPLGGHYRTAAEMIGVFYGVGALVTTIAAFALGRFALSVPVATGAATGTATAGTTAAGTTAAGTAAAADGEASEEAAPRRRGLIRRRRGATPAERERERGEGVSRY